MARAAGWLTEVDLEWTDAYIASAVVRRSQAKLGTATYYRTEQQAEATSQKAGINGSSRQDRLCCESVPMHGKQEPKGIKVSVITTCFNAVTTIESTIRSVCDQTYEHIEHIIVDGGSTDGTLEAVDRYRDRITKFISEPDKGIYDAMNKGLCLASGEVVGFLNADDVYASSTVISEIVAVLQAGRADAVYGDLAYASRHDASRLVRYWRAGEYRPRAFFCGWVPPHPTFFCRTLLYRELGGFDPVYRVVGDFELMLRFIEKHKIRIQYVPKPFVMARIGGRNNTLCGIIQGNREIIRAFHSNGLEFPSPLRSLCMTLYYKMRQFCMRQVPVSSLSLFALWDGYVGYVGKRRGRIKPHSSQLRS